MYLSCTSLSTLQVLPLSTWQSLYCGCNHLTSFGGGMVVPMNSVDLNNSAFLNLSSNPIVFATMVSIMCLYLALCVWARKKDKEDTIKVNKHQQTHVCHRVAACLHDHHVRLPVVRLRLCSMFVWCYGSRLAAQRCWTTTHVTSTCTSWSSGRDDAAAPVMAS